MVLFLNTEGCSKEVSRLVRHLVDRGSGASYGPPFKSPQGEKPFRSQRRVVNAQWGLPFTSQQLQAEKRSQGAALYRLESYERAAYDNDHLSYTCIAL